MVSTWSQKLLVAVYICRKKISNQRINGKFGLCVPHSVLDSWWRSWTSRWSIRFACSHSCHLAITSVREKVSVLKDYIMSSNEMSKIQNGIDPGFVIWIGIDSRRFEGNPTKLLGIRTRSWPSLRFRGSCNCPFSR
jgi:hypothetical protein